MRRWLGLVFALAPVVGCSGATAPPGGAPDAREADLSEVTTIDRADALDDGEPSADTLRSDTSAMFDASFTDGPEVPPLDAPSDVAPEAPPAGPPDTAPETSFDAAQDPTSDPGPRPPDAPLDSSGELGPDATADAPRDTAADAARPPGTPAFPFGSHPHAFAAGSVTPSRSTASMDGAVAALYDRWKAAHLRQRCGAGRYLVDTTGETSGATVSEAHGWGMLLVVWFAGHDFEARTIFDGMVRYYQDHPSAIDPALMAWTQARDCRSIEGSDSATDGDLDIAYALLLADRQWGSAGAMDYASLARRILAAILRREVHPSSRTLLVGDWATTAEERDGTRLSDYMYDHLRAFHTFTADRTWDTVLSRSYEVTATLQRDFTAEGMGGRTGLLPDFAVGMNTLRPRPAPAGWLETEHDGHYYWNACRTPWRIATDFLLHGEPRAREAARTMTLWARRATADTPSRVATGYRLDGTRIASGAELAFIAPFAAAAAVDVAFQPWLDALWTYLVETPFAGSGYYGNTIRLLVMLTVSRNIWAP
ncbi:MAG: hypothetical protein HY909_19650 [Deltaproteobacteria bacterium]|nr:hypothetical protein [Deltaproteobacteria bacterium]